MDEISKNLSANCNTLDTTWERIETTPELPVNHGDTIQLSCQTGYSLAGSDTATCNDGGVNAVGGEQPFCFRKFWGKMICGYKDNTQGSSEYNTISASLKLN